MQILFKSTTQITAARLKIIVQCTAEYTRGSVEHRLCFSSAGHPLPPTPLAYAVYIRKAVPAGQLAETYSTFSCDRSHLSRQECVSGVSSYIVFHSAELFIS